MRHEAFAGLCPEPANRDELGEKFGPPPKGIRPMAGRSVSDAFPVPWGILRPPRKILAENRARPRICCLPTTPDAASQVREAGMRGETKRNIPAEALRRWVRGPLASIPGWP